MARGNPYQEAGAYIKACLEAKGLTQTQLAALVGTSSALVNQWVRGTCRASAKWIPALERTIGVDPEKLGSLTIQGKRHSKHTSLSGGQDLATQELLGLIKAIAQADCTSVTRSDFCCLARIEQEVGSLTPDLVKQLLDQRKKRSPAE